MIEIGGSIEVSIADGWSLRKVIIGVKVGKFLTWSIITPIRLYRSSNTKLISEWNSIAPRPILS